MSEEDSRLRPIEKAIGTLFTFGITTLVVWDINITNNLQQSNVDMLGKINLINERIIFSKDQYETKHNIERMRSKLSNEIALIRANINQCSVRVSRIEKIMEHEN